jgi:uncharacterized protein (DUF983 family)
MTAEHFGAVCQRDLEQSTITVLECPRCGSSEVSCTNGFITHVHECMECHLREEIE